MIVRFYFTRQAEYVYNKHLTNKLLTATNIRILLRFASKYHLFFINPTFLPVLFASSSTLDVLFYYMCWCVCVCVKN